MRLLGVIFSAIFVLIAVPLFAMATCNLAIESAFLNRSTYDAILEDDAIFEEMLGVALPLIFTAPDTEDINFEGREESPIQIRDLGRALEDKPEVWAEVANLLVPPDWLQITITQFVDTLFAIMNGDFAVLDDTVNLSEVRQRFTGAEAEEAARLIITEAPACSDAQLEELQTFFSTRSGVMPICNPADISTQERMRQVLVFWLAATAQNLGEDQVNFSEFYGVTRDDARRINLLVELDKQGLLLTYLCPLAFLSLIVVFAVRSLKGFGRWIGSASIASGVVILLAIFAVQVAVFNIVAGALTAETDAELFFARLGSAFLRSAFTRSSSNMLVQAAIFIGIGFALFVIAGFAGRTQDDTSSSVLITEDGQIISTATQKRLGRLTQEDDN